MARNKLYGTYNEKKDWARFLVERIKADGGITINAYGEEPAHGYALATEHSVEKQVALSDFSWATVFRYLRDNIKLLNVEGNYLGAWVSDGVVFLDVSTVTDSKAKAYRLCAERGERAYFDLDKFVSAYVY